MQNILEKLLINLIPTYARLYKKANMLLFIISYQNFDKDGSISDTMFGKDLKGLLVENTFVNIKLFLYALYLIMDYLLPSVLLNNCQIIFEISGKKVDIDNNISTIFISHKTKFKEKYEARENTLNKDLVKILEEYKLTKETLIHPHKIVIKFLLNDSYQEKEIFNHLQFALNKVNYIRKFQAEFNNYLIHDIILKKHHGITFEPLQTHLLEKLREYTYDF